MTEAFPTSAALNIPEKAHKIFTFKYPSSLIVAGEIGQADQITTIRQTFNNTLRFTETVAYEIGGTVLQILALPHGQGKSEIRKKHPNLLSNGNGLNGYTSDALFVGPDRGKISAESAVWIGRALATASVEKVFYLNKGADHIDGLFDDPKMTKISDPFDCIRASYVGDPETDLGLTQALELAQTNIREAIK